MNSTIKVTAEDLHQKGPRNRPWPVLSLACPELVEGSKGPAAGAVTTVEAP